MVDVRIDRCGEQDCSTRSSLGAVGVTKAAFCATHARAKTVSVRSDKCSEEGCSNQSSKGTVGDMRANFGATQKTRTCMISVRSDV